VARAARIAAHEAISQKFIAEMNASTVSFGLEGIGIVVSSLRAGACIVDRARPITVDRHPYAPPRLAFRRLQAQRAAMPATTTTAGASMQMASVLAIAIGASANASR
jgi:hypothetical protein